MKPQRAGRSDDGTGLLDLLRQRAQEQPERRAFGFDPSGAGAGDETEVELTYGGLDRRARSLAARLQDLGLEGSRALLVYPPGLEFLVAFFGCLYAGVVAVPAAVPRPRRPAPRLNAIVEDCRPAAVLTVEELLPEADRWCARVPALEQPRWIATNGLEPEAEARLAERWQVPGVGPDTIAFLQYTSGSTAAARGVMVSHDNLRHNSALIQHCFASDAEAVGVTWLPLYHDMGLIGGMLQTIYCGGSSTLLAPAAFLQRPACWLEAISRTGASISGGPNFAYDLCARKVTDEQRAGLDLSRWTVAFNGAEPVRPETIDRFVAAFAPCGFRREAFLPCYGLAEATLLVSGGPVHARPTVFHLRASALEQHRVEPAPAGEPGVRTLAGSGVVAPGQTVAIVDPESRLPCPPGRIGEIWVAGPSVARGYWNRPEETEATFGATLADTGSGPFLRTGDLGFLDEGELVVTGRLKDLIIVRGRNVYPQDVEWTVERSHPALLPQSGAVFSITVGEGDHEDERLVVVHEVDRRQKAEGADAIVRAIRRQVAEEHDLDLHAVCLIRAASIPKTSSGKIQRHACRDAFLAGTLDVVALSVADLGVPAAPAGQPAPTGRKATVAEIEAWLVARLAATLGEEPGRIDVRAPLASLGLGSLRAVELAGALQEWLGRPLAPTLVYEYPTIAELAAHLAGTSEPRERDEPPTTATDEPIAIIGIGCRFPGASGPEAFWRLVRDGVDAVGRVPEERWKPGDAEPGWGGFLDQVDRFDAAFFGISPREAVRLDPQQRLLLEVAWEALEDAGQAPDRLAGSRTGVFVGISTNDYARLNLSQGQGGGADAYSITGNAASLAANRLSYLLDLHGPSLAVDTACSSSLVAVHLACQSLRSGESTLALAGGVNVLLSPEIGASFAEAGFLSADGRCKPFDARADGYVRGEGAGVVVLKPLGRALTDGDPIVAVIRGSAVNQDGRSNGLTAPSLPAQEAVLRAAYHAAGVTPGAVQYVEAHGSGTPLGDPIEARALGRVHAEGRAGGSACRIGSVKSNIGHLEAAAGIAGLIKAALAVAHRSIPPSLHFHEGNPHIPFDDLGLAVARTLEEWPAADRVRAGVSSFGFGGTNAHLVLEERPAEAERTSESDNEAILLPVSARSREALRTQARQLAALLESAPEEFRLADVAYTASLRRSHHDHRLAIVARSSRDAAARLAEAAAAAAIDPETGTPPWRPRLVFVCPGQGSSGWARVGRSLLEREPAFRVAIEEADACFAPLGGWSLAAELTAGEEASRMHDPAVAQPLILAVQLALAALWRSWGVVPEAVVGHSLGEAAAACLAGALTLEDAFRVVHHRGRLMSRVAGQGLTAALGLTPDEALRRAGEGSGGIDLAAHNGPRSCTVSGPPAAVRALVETLEADEVFARLLDVPCAFHGAQMDPLLDPLAEALAALKPALASMTLVSTVTGQAAAGPELDAAYWQRNLRETVRFADAVATLADGPPAVFLELGPHPALGASISQQLAAMGASGTVVASLRRDVDEREALLGALATLYGLGQRVGWAAVAPAGRVVPLPAYPWQRERFWLEPAGGSDSPLRNGHARNGKPAGPQPGPLDYVYQLKWTARARPAPPAANGHAPAWLIVADRSEMAHELRGRLEAKGAECVVVPARGLSQAALERALAEPAYRGVVYLGGLGGPSQGEPTLDDLARAQTLGLGGALAVAQTLARTEGAAAPRLWLVTQGAQEPVGGPAYHTLGQAPLWGLGRSIAAELPALWGGLIDVDPDAPASAAAAALAEELLASDGEDQVVLRRAGRFVPRLVRGARPTAAQPLAVRPERTYLITGGLGELGLHAARWLVHRGARRLVLLGRRRLPRRSTWSHLPPDDNAAEAVAAIQELERLGATVVTASADVADVDAMGALFDQLRETLPPLAGIVHAAGLVSSGSIRTLEADDLDAVLRPKVAGTWVLHELTRAQRLDFVVLFSSVASVLGAKEADYAAANVFLDAYAQAAQASGRPVLSVNWGPWAGAGMAASAERQRGFQLLGLAPLEPGRALRALESLDTRQVQAVVADVDWSRLRPFYSDAGRRLLDELDDRTPAGGRAGAIRADEIARWRAAPRDEGQARLVDYFRNRVAAVLQLDPERIDPARPLNTLGLDSLTAMELKESVEADLGTSLPLTALMQGPTLTELAEQILLQWEAAEAAAPAAVPPLRAWDETVAEHPLSHAQRSLWYVYRLDPASAVYNIAGAARVRTVLDVEALHRALQRLVDRHPALRTVFAEVDSEPVQRVRENAEVWFRVEDASAWTEEAIGRRLAEEAERPFDLESGPPFRTWLFRRGPRENYLLLAVHHIVSDFWSVAVLLHELGQLVTAEQSGAEAELEPLELRYTDYARWENAMLASAEGERLWSYWQGQLGGPLPVLELPADRPRPAVPSHRGAARLLRLNSALTRGLAGLGEAQGCSLFVTLLAALATLLGRQSGQDEVVIGSPVAGRNRKGLSGVVGHFVNLLPLRADLAGDPPFVALLDQVKQTVLAGIEHQEFPFPLLVERLQPTRDPSRSPLFQVLFTFQKAQRLDREGLTPFALREQGPRLDLGGVALESVALPQQTARYDLALTAAEAEGSLLLSLEYSTDLFDAATVDRMLARFQTLLEGIVATPDRPLSDLPLLPEDERRRILFEWNGTGTGTPPGGDPQTLGQLSDEEVDSLLESLMVDGGSS